MAEIPGLNPWDDEDEDGPGEAADSRGEPDRAEPEGSPIVDPRAEADDLVEAEPRRVDESWIVAARIAGLLRAAVFAAVVVIGAGALAAASDEARRFWPALVALSALLVVARFVHAALWPALAWRHLGWRVDPTGLEIRSGVLWRSVAIVPLSRIQHTDLSRGPLERRFGLATLLVHTAGTTNDTVSLPGLASETADRLRAYLIAGSGHARR